MENKDYYKNIEIVVSSGAGYGKSYYINKKCKEEGLNYISFPIGGQIKRQTIMRRLKELDLNCGSLIEIKDLENVKLEKLCKVYLNYHAMWGNKSYHDIIGKVDFEIFDDSSLQHFY